MMSDNHTPTVILDRSDIGQVSAAHESRGKRASGTQHKKSPKASTLNLGITMRPSDDSYAGSPTALGCASLVEDDGSNWVGAGT